MDDVDGTGAFEAEKLEHAFMVVDGQWIVATEVGKLVKDVDRQIPFVGIGWFRIPDLVLLSHVTDDGLGPCLDDDVAGFDDGCM